MPDIKLSPETPSARGFFTIAGQQFLGIALGIGVWIMLARMLPISEFGEFTAAFGLAMLGGAFANLGLPQYVMLPFRKAISSGDFNIARGIRRVMPWLLIGSGCIAYGVIIGVKEVLGTDCSPREQSVTTVLALLPLTVLMRYLAATAQAHGAPGRAMFLTEPVSSCSSPSASGEPGVERGRKSASSMSRPVGWPRRS